MNFYVRNFFNALEHVNHYNPQFISPVIVSSFVVSAYWTLIIDPQYIHNIVDSNFNNIQILDPARFERLNEVREILLEMRRAASLYELREYSLFFFL